MCETCGCHLATADAPSRYRPVENTTTVSVLRSLLQGNNEQAAHNRAHFDRHGVLTLNLMSAPGSGKTSLLEATIDALRSSLRVAVIEGDLETENDAMRIRAKGVPAVQITTGTACHLDARMVHDAVHALDLANTDVLFIENVGNLVCPASFDLGQHRDVVLLSAAEGDDKPAKYPVMFRAADLVLVTKSDLLPVLDDFSPARAQQNLRNLASEAPVFELSARRPGTLAPWLRWLRDGVAARQARVAPGASQGASERLGVRTHAGQPG
jgi:hydrogenase nickel incorporation protein HypB